MAGFTHSTMTTQPYCTLATICAYHTPCALFATGQIYREDRFDCVGSRIDLAPVCPSNLARDIQSEPQTVACICVLMFWATLQWIKNEVEGRSLNGGASIPHFQQDFRAIAGRCHTYGRVLRSVLDCVQDEIAEQLL
jgi:hypothetical protein